MMQMDFTDTDERLRKIKDAKRKAAGGWKDGKLAMPLMFKDEAEGLRTEDAIGRAVAAKDAAYAAGVDRLNTAWGGNGSAPSAQRTNDGLERAVALKDAARDHEIERLNTAWRG